MGWIANFFSSDGGMHQVTRTGSVINDLSTGRSGFVLSDGDGMSIVSDDRGHVHQFLRNGSMTTDLTTGKTYFEI